MDGRDFLRNERGKLREIVSSPSQFARDWRRPCMVSHEIGGKTSKNQTNTQELGKKLGFIHFLRMNFTIHEN